MPNMTYMVLSHTFAAIMTLTVLMFPAPRDLLALISYDPAPPRYEMEADALGQALSNDLERLVSTGLAESVTPARVVCSETAPQHSALGNCRFYHTVTTTEAANLPRPLVAPLSPRAADLELAVAEVCRARWTAARSAGKRFDLEACYSRAVAIATNG